MHEIIHPQVAVDYGDTTVEVDELMAPLLKSLWGKGIETEFSCQGDGTFWPPAYIMFAHIDQAAVFAEFGESLGTSMTLDSFGDRGRVMFHPADLPKVTEAWA